MIHALRPGILLSNAILRCRIKIFFDCSYNTNKQCILFSFKSYFCRSSESNLSSPDLMPDTLQSAGRSRALSKEKILKTAIHLMETLGESAFSLRKLGVRLGCDPMAVLYHFKSKEGLQRAMADWLTSQLHPVDETLPWQQRLRNLATQYRGLAIEYPQTFSLLQRFLNTGISDLQYIEQVYRALTEAGIDEASMPTVCVGWYSLVYGLAMAEVGGLIHTPTQNEIKELDHQITSEYPITRQLLPHFVTLDPAEVFTLTHDTFLAGIQLRLTHGKSQYKSSVKCI